MNFILALARVYIPTSVKKKRLHELFNATADAFQCPARLHQSLGFKACLERYAVFTREQAEAAIRQGKQDEVKSRLYRNAFQLSQEFKESYHVSGSGDIMTIAGIIYRILGIDFKGDYRGRISIKRCYFSSFYSGEVCELISSLDQGLLEGLSGGKFRFTQRMTEGNTECKALLSFEAGPD
jgi:hypothetical protein